MGAEARTRLALLGLVSVALLSFVDMFARSAFIGPAFLGALVAIGLSMGARRIGMPTWATLCASFLLLYWYLGIIFEPHATTFTFPGPQVWRGLWDAARIAYDRSRIDFAPVPVREGYVALLTAGVWTAAAVGETATFRWRRPLIAALPCIALFSLELIVGAGHATWFWVGVFLAVLLTYLAAESTHELRFWGRWVTAWSDRAPVEDADTSAPLARRMAVTCVLGAFVAPLVLPGLGSGLLAWRNLTGNGPGGEGVAKGGQSGVIDPLVSLAPHLINQSRQVMFRVDTEQPEYIRLVTLTHFDGREWTPPDQDINPILDGNVTSSAELPRPAAEVTDRITIDGLRGSDLPAVDQPVAATLGSGSGGKSLQVTAETGDLRLSGGLDTGVNYEVTSQVPDVSFEDLKDADVGHPPDPELAHLLTPLSLQVRDLRDRWTAGADTPTEKLSAIQEHLRRFNYSVTAGTHPTQNYLARFLLIDKTGYCQQFATAFALLSRSLGYPTRVVVGFLPGHKTPDGSYVVRGSDTHAWPEVYFDGFGWVRFEPTPRNDSVTTAPPPYTAAGGTTTTTTTGKGKAAGNKSASQLRRLKEREGFDPTINKKHRRVRTNTKPHSEWLKEFKRVLTIVVLLVIAVLGSIPLLKRLRIRRRYDKARDERAATTAAFAQFGDDAASLALPRFASESASAFALRVAAARSLPEGVALRLARLYDAAQYSQREVSRSESSEARSLARRLESSLWAQASLVDRATLLFSPRSLVPANGHRRLVARTGAPSNGARPGSGGARTKP